ncbi:MAG: hypothetical protein AAB071_05685 [Bacteroidota bacterium]
MPEKRLTYEISEKLPDVIAHLIHNPLFEKIPAFSGLTNVI